MCKVRQTCRITWQERGREEEGGAKKKRDKVECSLWVQLQLEFEFEFELQLESDECVCLSHLIKNFCQIMLQVGVSGKRGRGEVGKIGQVSCRWYLAYVSRCATMPTLVRKKSKHTEESGKQCVCPDSHEGVAQAEWNFICALASVSPSFCLPLSLWLMWYKVSWPCVGMHFD